MGKFNVLEVNEIPVVAMDAMNGVHRDELNIVNNVNRALVDNEPMTVTQLCREWLEHTRAHFDKENAMMEKYNFPAQHCHQREHVEALQTLEATIEQWNTNQNKENLAEYVRNIWPKWYVNHISTMDIVTSAFIKSCIDD